MMRNTVRIIKDGSIHNTKQLSESEKLKIQLEEVQSILASKRGASIGSDFEELSRSIDAFYNQKKLRLLSEQQQERSKRGEPQDFPFATKNYDPKKAVRIYSADTKGEAAEASEKHPSFASNSDSSKALKSSILSHRNMEDVEEDLRILMKGSISSDEDQSSENGDPLLSKAHIMPYSKYAALKNLEESVLFNFKTPEHQALDKLVEEEEPKINSELQNALKDAFDVCDIVNVILLYKIHHL